MHKLVKMTAHGRPISDVIDPTVPTAERAMGDKARGVRAIPVPDGADLDMLANSGRLIIGENGKHYIDVSDYKQGPDKFNLYRVAQTAFDEEGTPKPIFERQNLLVHPDFQEPVMQAFQDSSWFRQNPIAAKVLGASTQVKKSLLSLSPFHWVTEGIRGMQMGLNPAEVFNPPKIDPEGLAVTEGTKHGLTLLGDMPGRNQFAEGVGQNAAWVQKLPVLGDMLHTVEDKLFQDYIPRLKATTFEELSDQLAKKNPDWNETEVYKRASDLTNATYGGLNYKQLGLSLTGQDALRMVMLAPDFTGRQLLFAKHGFEPGGSAVWQSFARIGLYNMAVAQLPSRRAPRSTGGKLWRVESSHSAEALSYSASNRNLILVRCVRTVVRSRPKHSPEKFTAAAGLRVPQSALIVEQHGPNRAKLLYADRMQRVFGSFCLGQRSGNQLRTRGLAFSSLLKNSVSAATLNKEISSE